MTRHRRVERLEQRREVSGPGPHDDCLSLLQARSWAGQAAVLDCFCGPAEACPHYSWSLYCQRRDSEAAELDALIGLEEGPDISPEAAARQAEGLAQLRATMTAPLERLEAKLARRRGEGQP